MKLTDRKLECMEEVALAGALSTRRLDREYGPGWRVLVDAGMLRVTHTQGYGAVAVVTKKQREAYRYNGMLDTYPYISGPTSAANRALQNDLRAHLEEQGYRWAENTLKVSGLRDQSTNLIVSQTFRVPSKLAERLGDVSPRLPQSEPWQGPILASRGYPRLYATVGATGAQVARWYRYEHYHIDTWRHPMMVGLVRETPDVRAAVRRIEAAWRRAEVNERPRIMLIISA
ncbi:hypothetical protein Dxin01_03036 [Deinococcus xinjiangensis]|uniref:Uncharacterized protein n=1 Tax=Deinococcus xinjiangensis TaxID=457454 RepID=A0ABP9VDG6_9DEIO